VTTLLGQEAAERAILDASASGRMHHAWLLAGPRGVGKASFAVRAATRLLAAAADPELAASGFEVAENHPVARLMSAGSHPDYRRLERLTNEKTGVIARSITVGQVRALLPMFAMTPALSPKRVILVDAVDDLERPAANALLKSLEEPPVGTLFFLISHTPGRLLPTIRSRCRMLRFMPLDISAITRALRIALPEAPDNEIAALARAGEGSPGRALRFAGLDLADLDRVIDLLAEGGDSGGTLRSEIARQLSGKGSQGRYEAFLERAPARISFAARQLGDAPAAVEIWEQARKLATAAIPLSLDPQATVFELAGLVAALAAGPSPAKA
jgi:DNA polymerase III subunit delta'